MNNYAYILSYGRPHNVKTHRLLTRQAPKTQLRIVLSDDDETIPQYEAEFGAENIRLFSREQYTRKPFDTGVPKDQRHRKGVVHARNAVYDIAAHDGVEAFVMLDDDYQKIYVSEDGRHVTHKVKDLHSMLQNTMRIHEQMPKRVAIIAYAQSGDMIDGWQQRLSAKGNVWRKAMNFFFCRTDRRVIFKGMTNEDVSAYTSEKATTGQQVFLTFANVCIWQAATQQQAGGLTGEYLDTGTYVKTMHSVVRNPTGVKLHTIHGYNPRGEKGYSRIHHKVVARNTYPKIVRESV